MSIPCRSLHEKSRKAGGAGQTQKRTGPVHGLQPPAASAPRSPRLQPGCAQGSAVPDPCRAAGAAEAVLAGGWQARDACVTARCVISVKWCQGNGVSFLVLSSFPAWCLHF